MSSKILIAPGKGLYVEDLYIPGPELARDFGGEKDSTVVESKFIGMVKAGFNARSGLQQELAAASEDGRGFQDDVKSATKEPRQESFSPPTEISPVPNANKVERDSPLYPRFVQYGDDLIRVGWSEKKRGEYEQRCPFQVVELIGRELVAAGAMKRPVTMETLLGLCQKRRDGILSYQVSAAVCWLKTEKLVRKHGRRGYTLNSSDDFQDLAKQRFQQLPEC